MLVLVTREKTLCSPILANACTEDHLIMFVLEMFFFFQFLLSLLIAVQCSEDFSTESAVRFTIIWKLYFTTLQMLGKDHLMLFVKKKK